MLNEMNPTLDRTLMNLSDPPEPESFVEENYQRLVDLKWSLWLMSREEWEDRYPGLWDWMREWFEASTDDSNPESGGKSDIGRIVQTAPRKEIRYGSVEFQPGVAYVHFWAEWDSGRQFHIGSEWEPRTIEAETFEEVMHLIDHCEIDLMREQHAAYHGKQGERLTSVRCIECGYPYRSTTSKRLRPGPSCR